jgi:integrase
VWICLLPCLPLHLQFALRTVPSSAVLRYKQRHNGCELLSEAEVERFLACAEQSPLSVLFRMALLLGLRRGELLGLQWSDLDLERGTLTV